MNTEIIPVQVFILKVSLDKLKVKRRNPFFDMKDSTLSYPLDQWFVVL